MVNEQVLVSLLLAGPGVLATLTLAPLVITLFYSAKFEAAVDALRWICLGMSLRVITWPLGFIVVAKGLQALFIWVDLVCAVVHLGLAWLLIRTLGLEGAGMAFFGLYVFHGLIIYPIARRTIAFRWSSANKRLGLVFVPTIAVVFTGFRLLPPVWSTVLGLTAVVLASLGSLRILVTLVPPDSLPAPVRRLLARVSLLGSSEGA
jgi:antigen flippase